MKNTIHIYFILILIISVERVNSQQSAYYDAMFIYENCLDKDEGIFIHREDLYAVLEKYYPPGTQLSEELLKENPFFRPYVPVSIALSGADATFRDAISSVGNLNVTNFADGLAKFLVARAKEELNVAFFRKFQEFIADYPEAITLFPNTYDFIKEVYAYQYAAILPALRTAFQLDMNDFSTNLIQLRELTPLDCRNTMASGCANRMDALHSFLNGDVRGRAVVGTLISARSIMDGNSASDILNEIAQDEICTDHDDNFSNIIQFAKLTSNSLRSRNEGEIWVNKTELHDLLSKKDGVKIFFGLLYASDDLLPSNIKFTKAGGEPVLFKNLLAKAADTDSSYMRFRKSLSDVGNAAAETSKYAGEIIRVQESEEKTSILVYADYVGAISKLLKSSTSFFNTDHPQLAHDISLFTHIVDDAVNACFDIKSQNYSSLVLHTSQILDTILGRNYTFKDEYKKYGTFMAGIIEADNSDEVKAAIEAAVLPVGSASIKRETFSNITLNAFIGPMAGTEYLGAQTTDQWAPVVGVTAPLGVAFNWGNYGNGKRKDPPEIATHKNGNEKGGKSLTLFIPLIDVGSIATFRLSDDSSDVAADIKLENIIAPGLYFYYGLGKIPISLGLGGQVGPQLREINATDINIDKNFYVRFGFNAVVDIPFFNFYTRN